MSSSLQPAPETEGRTIPIVQTKTPAVTNEKDKTSEKTEEKMEQ